MASMDNSPRMKPMTRAQYFAAGKAPDIELRVREAAQNRAEQEGATGRELPAPSTLVAPEQKAPATTAAAERAPTSSTAVHEIVLPQPPTSTAPKAGQTNTTVPIKAVIPNAAAETPTTATLSAQQAYESFQSQVNALGNASNDLGKFSQTLLFMDPARFEKFASQFPALTSVVGKAAQQYGVTTQYAMALSCFPERLAVTQNMLMTLPVGHPSIPGLTKDLSALNAAIPKRE